MNLGPLLTAVAVVIAVAVRWRRLSLGVRIAGAIGVVALIAWGSGVVDPPNLETVARDLGRELGSYTYAVVGLMALLETGAGIGLVAPGELAVVIGGVTAGQGYIELPVLIAIRMGVRAGRRSHLLCARTAARSRVPAHARAPGEADA